MLLELSSSTETAECGFKIIFLNHFFVIASLRKLSRNSFKSVLLHEILIAQVHYAYTECVSVVSAQIQ